MAGQAASRLKFSGAASGDGDHGIFMALESMALGVQGKLSLWQALHEVRAEHPPIGGHRPRRSHRARRGAVRDARERERLAAARRALGA